MGVIFGTYLSPNRVKNYQVVGYVSPVAILNRDLHYKHIAL